MGGALEGGQDVLGDTGGVAESDAEPRCGGGGGEARLRA